MSRLNYIHKLSTVLLFGMLIITGILYIIFYDELVLYFTKYGYPTYLIYPLAIAKIIGSIVILYNKNAFLKSLAYAGFFFNFILAFFAHIMIGELDPFPTIFLILLLISYFSDKKISGK
ncbi:MAG: DoxX family protein [Flavobacteriaceae bacterium]|nr:DoxX family protein [Flavobacteriaceae bacterium]